MHSNYPMRILGYDLLRGICAMAIMMYHFVLWRSHYDLYNVGTFGVYIFFILSGASLTIAYEEKLRNGNAFGDFLLRRYIRLAPLYWIILLSKHAFGSNTFNTILNASFLFGFANPGTTARLGVAWSLGIEFVFYFTFPFFLALTASKTKRWIWLIAAVIIQYSYVKSIIIHPADWYPHWAAYTQFSSFIAYFFAGCIIGRIKLEHTEWRVNQYLCWTAFIITLTLITWISANSDYGAISHIEGLYLGLSCIILVFLTGYLEFSAFPSKIAAICGSMSYGVYLLHPRIYEYLQPLSATYIDIWFYPLICCFTIGLALLIEKYLEKPIKKYASRHIVA